MTIDTSVPESPGWWMQKASTLLGLRRERYDILNNWHDGQPPLPILPEGGSEVFRRLQRQACTNFAELIVASVRERISLRDIRTAVSGDREDDVAYQIWQANGLDLGLSDLLRNVLALSDGYMIVGVDDEGVVITSEDPRQTIVFADPVRQTYNRAAVKMFRDNDMQMDYIICYVAGVDGGPAMKYVASKESGYTTVQPLKATFAPAAFDWDTSQGGEDGIALPHSYVPVVHFQNKDGKGEFETHIPLLDRINHMVYNRMVIALYQAFRQRAILVDVDEGVDEHGATVDAIPDDLLTSDPGSWIQLPKDAEIWESGQADMSGIINSIKEDVMQLAAVTRRPMSIFAPDNQSAEGANFTREGLTFATQDRMTRIADGLSDVFKLAFLTLGDAERADKSKIIVGWNPPERYSLLDKAASSSQSVSTLARRTIARQVWQMSPPEVDQAEAEWTEERLLDPTPPVGRIGGLVGAVSGDASGI